jgi:hypothetical protein
METLESLSLRREYFGEGSVKVEPTKPGEGSLHRLAVTRDEFVARPADNINTTSDIIPKNTPS